MNTTTTNTTSSSSIFGTDWTATLDNILATSTLEDDLRLIGKVWMKHLGDTHETFKYETPLVQSQLLWKMLNDHRDEYTLVRASWLTEMEQHQAAYEKKCQLMMMHLADAYRNLRRQHQPEEEEEEQIDD